MVNLADPNLDDKWADWISQVAGGDESALGSFYDASNRLVFGLVFRVLGDAGAAEEVTLDVYLQVWRQANRFDPTRGRASTWLKVVARSRALDRLRLRPQERSQNESLEAVTETRSETPSPEEIAVVAQQKDQVLQTLNTLSEEHRQPIELAYFGGLSQSEIARKLNRPLGTIKTRIRHGMMELREKLRSREGELRSKQMSRKAG